MFSKYCSRSVDLSPVNRSVSSSCKMLTYVTTLKKPAIPHCRPYFEAPFLILGKVSSTVERFYIGVNDRQTENQWTAATESRVRCGEIRRTFWADGEPNNSGNNEHCTVIVKKRDPKASWYDVDCSTGGSAFSICQIFI